MVGDCATTPEHPRLLFSPASTWKYVLCLEDHIVHFYLALYIDRFLFFWPCMFSLLFLPSLLAYDVVLLVVAAILC